MIYELRAKYHYILLIQFISINISKIESNILFKHKNYNELSI
jgi:hypothetical protein